MSFKVPPKETIFRDKPFLAIHFGRKLRDGEDIVDDILYINPRKARILVDEFEAVREFAKKYERPPDDRAIRQINSRRTD